MSSFILGVVNSAAFRTARPEPPVKPLPVATGSR